MMSARCPDHPEYDLDASLSDGVLIGSCRVCGKAVVRRNPETGQEEWLGGRSPWTAEPEAPYRSPTEAQRILFEIERALRAWCGEVGDNDWPDDLHPYDVIDKHLVRPASSRIKELEVALGVEPRCLYGREEG
jgi:hypothetical protein